MRRPTPLDTLLLNLAFRLMRFSNPWADTSDGDPLENDPEQRFRFYYLIGGLWVFTYVVFAVVCIGVGAAVVSLGAVRNAAVVVVFAFGSAFCITGAADALWRNLVVWAARTRYRSAGRTVDDSTRRLIRIASVPDATIALQVGVGAFFAWRFAR